MNLTIETPQEMIQNLFAAYGFSVEQSEIEKAFKKTNRIYYSRPSVEQFVRMMMAELRKGRGGIITDMDKFISKMGLNKKWKEAQADFVRQAKLEFFDFDVEYQMFAWGLKENLNEVIESMGDDKKYFEKKIEQKEEYKIKMLFDKSFALEEIKKTILNEMNSFEEEINTSDGMKKFTLEVHQLMKLIHEAMYQ